MARSLTQTYESALDKLALDRDLSDYLSKSRHDHARNIAWRLARCADDVNIWFVNDPEYGWLHGRYWKCSSKLCSFCVSTESRRRRKVLIDALAALPKASRKWHFLTFTIENPSASITTTRAIVNEAWAKLRKRAAFGEVRAGAKSEEFTITQVGFHYHIHALLDTPQTFKTGPRGKMLPAAIDLRKAWTECVESSNGESRNLFGFNTWDGYLRIDFREVEKLSQIQNELCKYITKSTSFRSLSRSVLTELAAVRRWSRMFELIGELKKFRPRRVKSERNHSYVHTKSLTDGFLSDRWFFEKKRQESRYFMCDILATKFQSHVYSIHEIRELWSRSSNC